MIGKIESTPLVKGDFLRTRSWLSLIAMFNYCYFISKYTLHILPLPDYKFDINHVLINLKSSFNEIYSNPNGKSPFDYYKFYLKCVLGFLCLVNYFFFYTRMGKSIYIALCVGAIVPFDFLSEPMASFCLYCFSFILACFINVYVLGQIEFFRALMIEVLGMDNFKYYFGTNPISLLGKNGVVTTALALSVAALGTGITQLVNNMVSINGDRERLKLINDTAAQNVQIYIDACKAAKQPIDGAIVADIINNTTLVVGGKNTNHVPNVVREAVASSAETAMRASSINRGNGGVTPGYFVATASTVAKNVLKDK